MYSEKATKFCEIFPLILTVCTAVKSKGKILQNFVAFSEYMNFKQLYLINIPIHLGNCKICVAKKSKICKSKVRSNIDIMFHDLSIVEISLCVVKLITFQNKVSFLEESILV